MAKGQKRNNRETKKPKTAVKPANAAAAPTFLKPGTAGTTTASGAAFRSGKR